MKRLEGKVALVAGGSHGIGCVIAECFMDKGANVIVGDVYQTDAPVPCVTADNVAGDHLMGEWVTKNMPEDARVTFITGTAGSSTATGHAKGRHGSLKAGGGKFQPVAEQSGEFVCTKEMFVAKNMLNALTGNPPDAIICASGDLAQGVAAAERIMGLKGKAKIIGFDVYPQVLAAIEDGDITGIVEQSPFKQIRTALKMTVEKTREEADIETFIVQPFMVNRENLDQAELYSAIQ